ncbi:pyrimidine dimer DNA glycosylase/endonuclease V [Bacillaceae bacterium W0354]
MRIWSIHPKYLDAKGLVALWRETLLAQKVLLGETKGYTNHPQLVRFKKHESPIDAIGVYLEYVYIEAKARGYNFDQSKIVSDQTNEQIEVTSGQLEYEWGHLRAKLRTRDPERIKQLQMGKKQQNILPHPLFTVVKGPVEPWEKI